MTIQDQKNISNIKKILVIFFLSNKYIAVKHFISIFKVCLLNFLEHSKTLRY